MFKQTKLIILAIFCFFIFNNCEAAPTRRINYLHILKCGGTTIHNLLKTNFNRYEIYPFRSSETWGIYTSESKIEALIKYPMINKKVASGHFPFWFFQNKDPEFESSFYFTSLREPLERIISHYTFHQILGGNWDSPLDVPENLMCKMFASDPTLEGEELLEDSLHNLERMDFVIFMDEYFEEDIRQTFQLAGLKIGGQIPHYLRIKNKQTFDDEMMERIKEKNQWDFRFYHAAIEMRKMRDISTKGFTCENRTYNLKDDSE